MVYNFSFIYNNIQQKLVLWFCLILLQVTNETFGNDKTFKNILSKWHALHCEIVGYTEKLDNVLKLVYLS